MLDHEYLLKNLDYDRETGEFKWKLPRKRIFPGQRAGSVGREGYVQIRVDGRDYLAHRLAWFYVHGVWPTDQIDHKNLKRADNRIDNLREADRAGNSANRICYGASGFKGVRKHRTSGRWEARITRDKKDIHIGTFDTPEEAHKAFMEEAEKRHGEFARA